MKLLSLEEIKSAVDFNNKDVLLNIINTNFTKRELQETLYKSNLSNETLYKVLQENKNQEQIEK